MRLFLLMFRFLQFDDCFRGITAFKIVSQVESVAFLISLWSGLHCKEISYLTIPYKSKRTRDAFFSVGIQLNVWL